MFDLFSPEARRDPFALYDRLRAASPVFCLEPFDLWMIFDYDSVKRALDDHASFSSAAIPPGSSGKPFDWLIFNDPPRHTKLRSLVSQAFSPRLVARLEKRIGEISQALLDASIERGQMDLAADYSVQLPLIVIADLLGIPHDDRSRLKRWSDAILKLANTITGGDAGSLAVQEYATAKTEMEPYVRQLLAERLDSPGDDLLGSLAQAEVDGERLTGAEIFGFFQLLLLAGSETTINLINNAVICLLDHPEQFAHLRRQPALLPTAIEEVLRFRSPVQAVFRQTLRAVEINGETIPGGKLVLPMIGSANRDPKRFAHADRFDITRDPNPHIAFGHGVHFCLGAALSRLEKRRSR